MSEKQTAKRRGYTAEEKASALVLAGKKGVCAAARELGIPQTNVSKWAKDRVPRAGSPPETETTAPATVETKSSPVVDAPATATYGTRHIFGKIDQRELSASVRLDWTFTPKLNECRS